MGESDSRLTGYLFDFRYLAMDMQLFCLGLVLCVLLNKSRYQKIILAALFIVGMAIPGIITYLKDLDALLLMTPG